MKIYAILWNYNRSVYRYNVAIGASHDQTLKVAKCTVCLYNFLGNNSITLEKKLLNNIAQTLSRLIKFSNLLFSS